MSIMNCVVWRAVSVSSWARNRWRSASLRANHAAAASVEVIAMPASDPPTTIVMRTFWRCASRCFSSSSPTPSMPATSFSLPSSLLSLPGRMSAAIGSLGVCVSSPSTPI